LNIKERPSRDTLGPTTNGATHWKQRNSRGQGARFDQTRLEKPAMEQHALKNVNNCLNTNIYSYLETSGGQSSNPYLNVVHFFNTKVN
jgi:hypothetical protein